MSSWSPWWTRSWPASCERRPLGRRRAGPAPAARPPGWALRGPRARGDQASGSWRLARPDPRGIRVARRRWPGRPRAGYDRGESPPGARQTHPRLLDARSPRTTHLVLSLPAAVEFLQPSAVAARRPRKECATKGSRQPRNRSHDSNFLFNNREAGGRTSVRSPGFPEARCPEPSTHGMAVSLGVCAEPAGGRGWPGPTNRRMHGLRMMGNPALSLAAQAPAQGTGAVPTGSSVR
jgi:hypothetical protein